MDFLPATERTTTPMALLLLLLLVVGLLIVILGTALLYAVRRHASERNHVDAEELKQLNISQDSLFSLLQPQLVPMEEIAKRGYSSVLWIVQSLIGVQPTCDMVLEIWPPAFRCYNIIVPNFLNLPETLLGGVSGAAPKDLVSLAMYASSRANQCAYCTSHCCSFAMRRGVDPNILKNLLQEITDNDDDDNDTQRITNGKTSKRMNETERAVVKVAYGLGTVPCSLTSEDVTDIYKVLSEANVEWIVAAAAMFGAFNKLMDGLNIPLEPDTYSETVTAMDAGFMLGGAGSMVTNPKVKQENSNKQQKKPPNVPKVDDWTTKLALIYQGLRPGGAMALNKKLLAGTPHSATDCMQTLNEKTGCSFPQIFLNVNHERFRRAITAVITQNFNPEQSDGLGIRRKILAGIQYCDVLENTPLKENLKHVAEHLKVVNEEKHLQGRTNNESKSEEPLPLQQLVLKVAKAISYAPKRMNPKLVQQMREHPNMTPAMIVELVSFMACIQMMHRISSFYQKRRLAKKQKSV